MLPLIPTPKTCNIKNEEKHQISPFVTCGADTWHCHAATLCDSLNKIYGVSLTEGEGGIELIYDEAVPEGAYRLDSEKCAKIIASSEEGLCYGIATVIQLLEVRGDRLFLPSVEIYDYPDKSYRSLMVDLGREWHPFPKLLKYVDLCFFYKVRYLNLHFADNKLYTLPSRAFPKLCTEGKYYTEKEIEHLLEYARARGVVIIPEFECPGHAPVLNTHYPEVFADRTEGEGSLFYNESGQIIDNKALLCASKESAVEGVKTLIKEICELFSDAPYIHIGADEANISLWSQCACCREYMKKKGIDSVYGLYSDYVARMTEYVISLGKTPIVWEGFPEDGADKIPKETVVISWENHYQTTHQLLNEGFNIINASWKPLYIVPAMTAPHPLFSWGAEEIFNWNIYNWQHWWEKSVATKNPINVEPTERVIGAMLCAWEMTFEQEINHVMANLAALSERTWSVERVGSFEDFRNSFSHPYYVSAKLIADV